LELYHEKFNELFQKCSSLEEILSQKESQICSLSTLITPLTPSSMQTLPLKTPTFKSPASSTRDSKLSFHEDSSVSLILPPSTATKEIKCLLKKLDSSSVKQAVEKIVRLKEKAEAYVEVVQVVNRYEEVGNGNVGIIKEAVDRAMRVAEEAEEVMAVMG
jgi:hypothetical protein